MKRYLIGSALFITLFVVAGCASTQTNSTKEKTMNETDSTTSGVITDGPSNGERAAGEYLGFDILTFRHDPTYYDETDEYIEFQWKGPGSVNMAGYKIVGTSANQTEYTYTFPDVTFEAGETFKVYTQPGADRLSFGYNGEIWADDASEVRLYDPNEYLEAYYGQ